MGTQAEAFHNPAVRSSGKVRRNRFVMSEAKAAACRLAKRLALPLTFRNLYVIELAIEAEASRCGSISEAVEIIFEPAMDELFRGRVVNYFFFEDARWRSGQHGTRRLQRLAAAAMAGSSIVCSNCNDRGYIFNYGPGKRTQPCPECQGENR